MLLQLVHKKVTHIMAQLHYLTAWYCLWDDVHTKYILETFRCDDRLPISVVSHHCESKFDMFCMEACTQNNQLHKSSGDRI